MTLAKRLKAMGQPKYQLDGDPRTSGPGFGLTVHEDALQVPHSWTSPRVVFVNSMSDLFHEDVPIGFIRDVFDVITETPRHTYQVLTKRSKRSPVSPTRCGGRRTSGWGFLSRHSDIRSVRITFEKSRPPCA